MLHCLLVVGRTYTRGVIHCGAPAKRTQDGQARCADHWPAAATCGPAFPKPTRRPKAPRKPLRRTRMAQGASKTAHARRERAWGFMAYRRAMGCDLRAAMLEEFGVLAVEGHEVPECEGRVQFAHLALTAGRRRGSDMHGTGLCSGWNGLGGHHYGIDGKAGGKDSYYVALGREGQERLRERLRARALAGWNALTPEERQRWDEEGTR